MDPGSIATALQIASCCAAGAQAVYRFLRDVKNIDQTAAGFVAEVDALATACDAVAGLIEDQQRQGELERYWRCLRDRLQACEGTVLQLEVAIKYIVGGSQQNHNVFSPVIRSIYLNRKCKDIDDARIQITAHTTSLQIVLQVVAINVSSFSTGSIDRELLSHLRNLRGAAQELETIRAQRTRKDVSALDGDEVELLRAGHEALSFGETLYASSMSGSTYGVNDFSAPHTMYGRSNSVTADASVYGCPTPQKLRSTSTWVKDQAAIDMPSSPDTRVPSVFSHRDNRVSSAGGSLFSDNVDTPRPFDNIAPSTVEQDFYSDSDDEDEIEHIQDAIRSGQSLFKDKKYREATSRLQVAVRGIRKLPNKRDGIYDPFDLEYMLAICSFHIQPPAVAFDALLKVTSVLNSNTDGTDRSENNILRVLEATHLLSITCVRLGMMNHARSYCKAARKGRRRALKRDSLPYLESVALMAKIEELEGNEDDAEVFMDNITDEQRAQLDPAIQELVIGVRSRRQSLSTGVSIPQTGETSLTNGDPLRDIDFLIQKSRDLKLTPNNDAPLEYERETVPAPTADERLPISPTMSRTDTRMTATTIPIPLEELSVNDDYRFPALRRVAQAMGYRSPAPANENTRRTWTMFLAIKPKGDDLLTKALLNNRKADAFQHAHEQTQSRQRLWSPVSGSGTSRKDLHIASLFGDVEVVDRLILSGANVKHKWTGDLTALHCAAMGGYREIASKLIAAGCSCDASSEFGTPLSLAVLGQKIDVVDLLLAHTKNILGGDYQSGSAVHAAIAADNLLLLDVFTRGNGALDIPQLFLPAQLRRLGHLLTTNTMLDPPVDEALLASHTQSRLDRIEGPALACAAYMNSSATVERLLATPGTNINAFCKGETGIYRGLRTGSNQHTALTLASIMGNDAIVSALLARGASTASANYEHADPLFLAILNGRESTAILLSQHGAPVTPKSLDLATKKGMRELVGLIRKRSESVTPTAQSPAPGSSGHQSRSSQSSIPQVRKNSSRVAVTGLREGYGRAFDLS